MRLQAKLRIARAVFGRLGKADLESEGFRRFCADSWVWLQPYAVFSMLRRVFGTGEHWRWGALSQPTREVRARLMRELHTRHAVCFPVLRATGSHQPA